MAVDYPEEIGEKTQSKVLNQNQDSKYAKCIFLDRPDDMLLTTPISKICDYFEDQLAIFDNTDHFTTVNNTTFAIANSSQLRGSHLTSNSLKLLDAECNCLATVDKDRHLYYAYCQAGTGKTIVATTDGRLVTDTARSCYMIWNDAEHVFAKQTSVVKRVMHVYYYGIVILTDEGLARYDINDIKASTGTVIEPRAATAVVDASKCVQAFHWYVGDDGYCFYVVLTAKGMIQYVQFDFTTLKIALTAQMVEGLKSNTVFSAIACPRLRTPPLVVVAGFDVDRRANMMIVLNDKGDRLSKLDDISNGDGRPIVEMRAHHDDELVVTFIISRSIRSVYVHRLDAKHRLTQIFDRLMDGMQINGVIATCADGDCVELAVYGQRGTRGDIVRLMLKFDADEIRKLN